MIIIAYIYSNYLRHYFMLPLASVDNNGAKKPKFCSFNIKSYSCIFMGVLFPAHIWNLWNKVVRALVFSFKTDYPF